MTRYQITVAQPNGQWVKLQYLAQSSRHAAVMVPKADKIVGIRALGKVQGSPRA